MTKLLRAGLSCVLVAAALTLAGGSAAQAAGDTICPAVDGWTGPTDSSSQTGDSTNGGGIRCWYSPGVGSTLPSTTELLLDGTWVGTDDNGPDGTMPNGGCGKAPIEDLAFRQVNSAGTYSYVIYQISGAGAVGGEAILVADEARILDAVEILLPQLEAMAHLCDSGTDTPTVTVPPTTRAAGTNRYETATQIADAWTLSSVVFIATGQNFPDALGGGPGAAEFGAPILLVEKDAIPATTAAELTRLTPAVIIVLGGTAAISEATVTALGQYAATVQRIAGNNRYETAAAVSGLFVGPESIVYIASGRSYADPIIAGAAAALDGAPLLLVDGLGPLEAVVSAELDRLQTTQIVLVGASSDLTGVLSSLQAIASVTQVNNSDIYSRSAALWDDVTGPVGEVVLATSGAFADALAGTPYAALDPPSYLMLSQSTCVPAPVLAQLQRLDPDQMLLLGGTAALSASVASLTSC